MPQFIFQVSVILLYCQLVTKTETVDASALKYLVYNLFIHVVHLCLGSIRLIYFSIQIQTK